MVKKDSARNKKQKPKRVAIAGWIDLELSRKADELANEQGRSISRLVTSAVEEYVRRHEEGRAA
jgi:predicted transcriptional regulator